MDNQDIRKYLGSGNLTVAHAMRRIDENAGRILFLTDEGDRLLGCITDGDIRRFLLAGGKMDEPALKAANRTPKIASTYDEAGTLYHKKNYVAIPVLDGEGRIVDLYTGDGRENRRHGALKVPVVINAGGKGTRLDPFTRVLPKPLIPVGELPIIEHIMKEFQSYQCEEFHIIVNYKRELMKAYFAENENRYSIAWYDEEKPLGTGGGLSLLKGKISETFFFTNCDNLLTANYERMLEFHKENHNAVTMICATKNFPIPYGVVEMGVNGKIEAMKEKPLMSFLTNTGIYIVEPYVLDDIENDVAVGFPEIAMGQIEKGRNVAAFPVSENDWMDMGQLSELEKMRVRLYGE
ncbi:MAG: NTP transferase domain-containing protein [Lachnospiraceae bacterium]|nr:NTP transferase domain-containing protein [Lachnospiraceae bacterium]